MLISSLIILLCITSCTKIPIKSQLDSEEPVDNLLENLSILATQTQNARENLTAQQSTTPSPENPDTNTGITETPIKSDTTESALPTTPAENALPHQPSEIKFKSGGTSAYLNGRINAGEKQFYTVKAAGGQTMLLAITSDNKDVILGIKGLSDGQTLLSLSDNSSDFVTTLPSTQEYQITLLGGQTETYYFLSVEVPVDLSIEPGEIHTVDGYIEIFEQFHPNIFTRVRYLLSVYQGQTLSLKLESPSIDSLNLGMIGQSDGQRYLNYHVKGVESELKLPVTQGYYIDVNSTSGESTGFSLTVEIK